MLDTQEVGGSKPPVPTTKVAEIEGPEGKLLGASCLWGRVW